MAGLIDLVRRGEIPPRLERAVRPPRRPARAQRVRALFTSETRASRAGTIGAADQRIGRSAGRPNVVRAVRAPTLRAGCRPSRRRSTPWPPPPPPAHPPRRSRSRWSRGRRRPPGRDHVVGEEPLEIRVAGPGQEATRVRRHDAHAGQRLRARGGLPRTPRASSPATTRSRRIRYCPPTRASSRYNVLTIDLRRPFDPAAIQRNYYATSSCGVCGKASIDADRGALPGRRARAPCVGSDVIVGLSDTLRESQRLFDRTGGLHATGLFALDGALLAARARTWAATTRWTRSSAPSCSRGTCRSPASLLVSGRSVRARAEGGRGRASRSCARSPRPRALAVETARRLGVTLVGFLRGGPLHDLRAPQRIEIAAPA